MLREAIDRIVNLAAANTLLIGDRTYTDRAIHPCPDPIPGPVEVTTLTGFVDLVKAKIEVFQSDQSVIHVEGFDTVSLINKQSDSWGRRQVYIRAKMEEREQFPFGRFLDSETFAIWLQAGFVPERGDVDEITGIAANLTADSILNVEDDGIRQRVTVKKGVSLKENVTVKRRMKVAPYRTFREVEQPMSEVVFRVRQDADGQVPTCALFESDGGQWKLEAMARIRDWLVHRELGMPVVA